MSRVTELTIKIVAIRWIFFFISSHGSMLVSSFDVVAACNIVFPLSDCSQFAVVGCCCYLDTAA